MTERHARAFVPGHITGFFSAHPDEDPTRAGSRGGGIALAEGVTVTVEPGNAVTLNGDPIEVGAVSGVLDALNVEAAVAAETDLPLGAGFGVSGAMALGTALAANDAFDRRRSTNELVSVAHVAEVEAGTGLGDVVAQARGGIPLRLAPGDPQHNELDAIPARSRVEFVSFGGLSTEELLSGDTETLSAAGERALGTVVEEPTLPAFVRASRRFAREAGLLPETVREAVDAVEDADGDASMAMLGETVFALGTGLSDAGYDPAVTAIHPAGATLEPGD
jgi:pantoate kinase